MSRTKTLIKKSSSPYSSTNDFTNQTDVTKACLLASSETDDGQYHKQKTQTIHRTIICYEGQTDRKENGWKDGMTKHWTVWKDGMTEHWTGWKDGMTECWTGRQMATKSQVRMGVGGGGCGGGEGRRGVSDLVLLHLLQDEQLFVRDGSLVAQLSLRISQPVQQLLGLLVELVSLHRQHAQVSLQTTTRRSQPSQTTRMSAFTDNTHKSAFTDNTMSAFRQQHTQVSLHRQHAQVSLHRQHTQVSLHRQHAQASLRRQHTRQPSDNNTHKVSLHRQHARQPTLDLTTLAQEVPE